MKTLILQIICIGLFMPLTAQAESTNEDGFKLALTPRQWQFPRDHGKHDDYQTEWWYFTGNVSTQDGRDFGYQITFFRRGISPEMPERKSGWAAKTLYFAHAHISDIQEERYLHDERTSREHPRLAIASDETLDVFIRSWSARLQDDTIHLKTNSDDFSIDLQCKPLRGPVLQGDGGLSKKSDKPGHASYYYSLPRMETTGTLTIKGEAFTVSGLSWMDQEFSSQQLAENQTGWDWFSLQLNDGQDMMVYRLRNEQGQTDYAFCSLAMPNGEVRYFNQSQINMQPTKTWTSPNSGGAYPVGWRIELEGQPAFTIRSRFNQQEMTVEDSAGLNYYEGSIEARDLDGRPIGRGYLEMTGYDEPLDGGF